MRSLVVLTDEVGCTSTEVGQAGGDMRQMDCQLVLYSLQLGLRSGKSLGLIDWANGCLPALRSGSLPVETRRSMRSTVILLGTRSECVIQIALVPESTLFVTPK